MAPTIGVIAVAAAIAVIKLPALWRSREMKELWIFSLLLLFATGLSVAWVLHYRIPSPLAFLTKIYKPVYDMITRLLT